MILAVKRVNCRLQWLTVSKSDSTNSFRKTTDQTVVLLQHQGCLRRGFCQTTYVIVLAQILRSGIFEFSKFLGFLDCKSEARKNLEQDICLSER